MFVIFFVTIILVISVFHRLIRASLNYISFVLPYKLKKISLFQASQTTGANATKLFFFFAGAASTK
jgi:hypothetical protein